MEKKKFSLTYRFLRAIGLHYSETEYGQVTLWQLIARVHKTFRDAFLLSWVMNNWMLSPLLPRKIRPWVLRKIGCHVGKNVFVGDSIKVDSGHSDLITIEDGVSIAGGTRLLCHQRDFTDYCVGDEYLALGYILKPIVLKKGCLVGMESFIMPGVTVGEGAVVGAGSLVTKDVPAWTIATGRPAKVVKQIPERKQE
ncbi:MAG: acyltransferase [Bacteroidales bacterium]|nr:acyltransferase [Bacteroidales bacterium]